MEYWNNSEELAQEYANDLKPLRAQHRRYSELKSYYLEMEKQCQECAKWDESMDYRMKYEAMCLEVKEIASIISSSEYSIKWLRTGNEPRSTSSVEKLTYEQRTIQVSDVDQALMYLNTLKTDYKEMNAEDLEQLHIFLNAMTPREKDAFVSIKGQSNTYKQTAAFMGISESSVRQYVKRAEEKIEKYIENGLQISLF